jgi:(p)ppGpp synthase/HD superfamily hydrolase
MNQPQSEVSLGERYSAALEFAHALHREQRRKGTGAPYISHLLSVSALVLEYGGGEDEAIAALLHDAVEDQGGLPTLEQIRQRFGVRVAQLVAGCTEEQWEARGRRWQQRKDDFISALEQADNGVRLVVAADKLHNAYSYLRDYERFGEALWSRFKNGREGVTWFLRTAHTALLAGGELPILHELDAAIGRIENLK